MPNIKTRTKSALEDKTLTASQREALVATLHENSTHCTRQSNQSFVFFIALSAAFSLVAKADVPKVSILGIDFSKNTSILLLLPPLAAYFVYRASCLNQLATLIDKALEAHYELTAGSFATQKLLPLLRPPGSVLEIEDTLNDLSDSGSGLLTVVLGGLVVFGGTIIWLAWMVWWLFAKTAFALPLKIAVAVFVAMFVGKAVWVIRQTWSLA